MNPRFRLVILVFAWALCGVGAFPETLDELMENAEKHHPTVRAAESKVTAYHAKISQAWGVIYPKLSIDGTYSKLDSVQSQLSFKKFASGATFNIPTETEFYLIKASVNQLLYSGTILPTLRVSKAALDAVENEFRSVQQNAKWGVTQAFFGYLAAQEFADLARRNVAVLESHLAQTEAFFTKGVTTKTAVLQSKLSLSNAKKRVIESQKGVKLAGYQLNAASGIDIYTTLSPTWNQELLNQSPVSVDPSVLLEIAQKNRPDWLSLKKSEYVLEGYVDIAGASGLPFVSIFGSYGYGTEKLPFDFKLKDWMYGINVTWKLFDGSETHSQVKDTQSNLEKMRSNIKMALDGIKIEIEDAILSYRANLAALESAKNSLNLAVEENQLVTESYKYGGVSNLDVLESQFKLEQAQSELIRSKYDVANSLHKLKKVIGNL